MDAEVWASLFEGLQMMEALFILGRRKQAAREASKPFLNIELIKIVKYRR
jgi:hypothetical protein